MNLLRKYKLSKLLNQPLNKEEQRVLDFIDSWVIRLERFKSKYSENTFYMREDGKWVLEDSNDWLYVRNKLFCELIVVDLNVNDKGLEKIYITEKELEKFLTIYLGEVLNRKIRGVTIYKGINPLIVEKEYREYRKNNTLFKKAFNKINEYIAKI